MPAPATALETTTLYNVIAANCTHAGLNFLEVRNSPRFTWETPEDDNIADYMILGGAVQRLSCFVNLVLVSLQSPFGFDLDDATASALASAWPQLRILTLSADRPHCPRLSHLTIGLTAVTVPLANFGGPRQRCLRWLNVGVSPIAAPSQVATFLSAIFPGLQVVISANTSEESEADESEAEGEEEETEMAEVEEDDQHEGEHDDDDEQEENTEGWKKVQRLLWTVGEEHMEGEEHR
ncbi:hypothetical protein B0H14DRAFT_3435621 [Mycena olivaceomarginata]|nr:hypothetical protein B0H14DRAFT_3435621 [Mycena olivaceomarginata]